MPRRNSFAEKMTGVLASFTNEERPISTTLLKEGLFQEIHNVPIVSSYNDRIRPLLDAVDKLRHLNVMKEGIQLPTIVVVGDQSSGKSSVLESLAGISLPRGQGICTRVPLIMRLQNHFALEPELFLEFNGKSVPTDETHISDAVVLATDEIAGSGKGISNTPLTLVVKKKGVPDLTMVDLPGITRVPVLDQPEDIYEQIADIIMEYIRPEESIILNVLSATVDFPTCESIRMSRQVDKDGERTIAVVTKADKAPEGLLEKVTADDVNIGLGYICVRNRIGNESYEQAREEEANLFATHPLLSRIKKSIVGIPVLAEKLVQIQANIIAKCLPEIVRKINDKMNASTSELKMMPKTVSSVREAMMTLMSILGDAKESLNKIFIRGEYDEFQDNPGMHGAARLAEMINQYSEELHNSDESDPRRNFLMDEIRVLDEAKAIQLPNFLPRSAFLAILQRKVDGISNIPVGFIEKVWAYIEDVVECVLMHHSENYYKIQSSTRRASKNLIAKMKEQSVDWVTQIVQMDKQADYTCNPEYLTEWGKLIAQQKTFIDNLNETKSANIDIDGFGEVAVGKLRGNQEILPQAFDLKMRITAYWKFVLWRMVDLMALHLQHSVRKLVKEMDAVVLDELMGTYGGAIESMFDESFFIAGKREKLNASVKLLREAKLVLETVMENIAADVQY